MGQFLLVILVIFRQWLNHHYHHSRWSSSILSFPTILLVITSTTAIGFLPTAAASCSGSSKYGSSSNPFLNVGGYFLPSDDGTSIGKRLYSLSLSPIVKVGDFWGTRNLQFGWVGWTVFVEYFFNFYLKTITQQVTYTVCPSHSHCSTSCFFSDVSPMNSSSTPYTYLMDG